MAPFVERELGSTMNSDRRRGHELEPKRRAAGTLPGTYRNKRGMAAGCRVPVDDARLVMGNTSDAAPTCYGGRVLTPMPPAVHAYAPFVRCRP